MVRASVSRICRPRLVATFRFWLSDAGQEQLAAKLADRYASEPRATPASRVSSFTNKSMAPSLPEAHGLGGGLCQGLLKCIGGA